jgi:WD40 repeat protein
MAPERFAGQSDPRSDQYALGLTLYELLTLRPAFDCVDRNQLMAAAQHEEPTRPRKLNPEVPRDLETIVLKAMAKEPGHRYASAVALAEDLKRFVEDKPIRARPVGSVERLWRWGRRNPAVAGLLTAVALLLLAVAAVSAVAAVYLGAARNTADRLADEAKGRAEDAKQAEQRAEARLARLYTSNGTRALEQGDLLGSLPWFVEALKTDQNDPARAENHRVRLRAVLQQCPRAQFFGQDGLIARAKLSPDGSRVATITILQFAAGKQSRPETRVWDIRTGQFVRLNAGWVDHLAFSAGGCRVVTAGMWHFDERSGMRRDIAEARVWDAATGKPLGPPLESLDRITFMNDTRAFSFDGRRVVTILGRSGNAGEGVRLRSEAQVWDLVTGKAVTTPLKYDGDKGLEEAFFSPDGRLVYLRGWRWIAGEERVEAEEQIWDVATGRPLTPLLKRGDRGAYPPAAVFSPDGNRVLSYNPSTDDVWIWEAKTGQVIWHLDGSEQATQEVADLQYALLNPDGRRLLSVTSAGRMHTWDIATRKHIGDSYPHKGEIMPVVSPNGRRVITVVRHEGGSGEEVRVWDADTSRAISPPIPQDLPVSRASFSPDGSRILTAGWQLGAPGEVRVWDAATGRPVTPRLPFEGALEVASFTPDGRRLVVASQDGKVRLWDLAVSRYSGPSDGPRIRVSQPALNSDGRRTAVPHSQGAEAVDTATGRPIAPVYRLHSDPSSGYSRSYFGVTFSPDGRLVLVLGYRQVTTRQNVTGREAVARVFDAATGRLVTPLLEHRGVIMQGAFSPDGRRLLLVVNGYLPQTTTLTVGESRTVRDGVFDLGRGSPRSR